MKNSAAFDKKLMEEATAAGGRKYAELCALAYRQALAAQTGTGSERRLGIPF